MDIGLNRKDRGFPIPISKFAENVITFIKKIPKSNVATYKQIAELAGKPHASRAVSWILKSCSTSHKLPWHRVVNAKGKIAFEIDSKQFKLQRKLLIAEKIDVLEQGQIDLIKFQWIKKVKPTKAIKNSPKMFR